MSGKVIIIGSVNVDIVARAERLPRAGETVAGGDLSVLLGGKGANQAVAAAQAGANVEMIGAVGEVSFGLDPVAILRAYGIDPSTIMRVDGPSGAALITVDSAGENLITVSPGANASLLPLHVGKMRCGVTLAQLETPQDATTQAFRRARDTGALTLLNAAPAEPLASDLLALTDILIVNEIELATYAGGEMPSDTAGIDAAMRAVRHHEGQRIIATLGSAGVRALDGDNIVQVAAAKAAKVVDTTGAGDCFCGTLAARLAEGAELLEALSFAAAAASLAVETAGAAPSMPVRSKIEARLRE